MNIDKMAKALGQQYIRHSGWLWPRRSAST